MLESKDTFLESFLLNLDPHSYSLGIAHLSRGSFWKAHYSKWKEYADKT